MQAVPMGPGETVKPKRGRPQKLVDLELVERLAHIQCTHTEIASALNISVDTLARNRHFAEVYKRGAENGRKSLRRMQFESANRGNVVMQIWLGKQYLGQSDHVRSDIRRVVSPFEMTNDELQELIASLGGGKVREESAKQNALDANYSVVNTVPAALPPGNEPG